MHWPRDLAMATLISWLLVVVTCWLAQRWLGPLTPPPQEQQEIAARASRRYDRYVTMSQKAASDRRRINRLHFPAIAIRPAAPYPYKFDVLRSFLINLFAKAVYCRICQQICGFIVPWGFPAATGNANLGLGTPRFGIVNPIHSASRERM